MPSRSAARCTLLRSAPPVASCARRSQSWLAAAGAWSSGASSHARARGAGAASRPALTPKSWARPRRCEDAAELRRRLA
eukprot:7820894-Alexandrium_andersonii.AAC.1